MTTEGTQRKYRGAHHQSPRTRGEMQANVPRVGVVRDSMLTNPLLVKPSLGKAKWLLSPGPDFVYGTVTTIQDGGVAEALSNWRVRSVPNSGAAGRGHRPQKDFVALNREGVKSGLVTAKEHYQYRATQDRRLPAPAPGPRGPPPLRFPPDTTFGIASRPSTPIGELLEYQYAQRWLEEQQAKQRALQEKHMKKPRLGRIQDTRTTLLRKSRPLPETPTLWKLPRFQQVGPALNTFRDPEARRKAFSAQLSDSVARRGTLGQGAYTVG